MRASDPKRSIGTQICCDAQHSSHVVGCEPNGAHMKRRDFITLLGGATAWPLAARAQQGRLPVIGVLRPNWKDVGETFAEPFRRYMKAIGWEEGRNLRFLFVFARVATSARLR